MARNREDNEPIARGDVWSTYRQPSNSVGVQPQTPVDLNGAQNYLGGLQQNYLLNPQTGNNNLSWATAPAAQQNYGRTPNPVTQDTGGVMTDGANGISAGNSNVMTQQPPDNMMGLRDTLNKRGIYDIGWDDATKTVSVGGQKFKPTDIIDGVSYINSSDANRLTNEYYRQQGKPLEGADAYVAGALGVENAVTWSDGNLMVGGQLVPTVYVDDKGTAYAHKADLDKAIQAYRNKTGLQGNQSVVDDWNSRYGNQIKNALNNVLDRKEWSYDPYNDPAYLSYRDQYTREGDRAYQDAYANMAANTSGYGSSAAMNAAGQQWNYHMNQLNDRVPELMQNDYNRYLGEYDLRRNALNSLRDVAADDYSKQYQANRDTINDLNAANEASYQRRLDARDRNRSDYDKDRLWEYEKDLYADKVAQSAMDTERYGRVADLNIDNQVLSNQSLEEDIRAKENENWNANVQKILTSLSYDPNKERQLTEREAEEMGIWRREDGSYPTVMEVLMAFAEREVEPDIWKQNEIFNRVTKPQLEYQRQLSLQQ